ncbi:MAG: hypothetical protein WA790_17240 [Sulfitobacter sp.]
MDPLHILALLILALSIIGYVTCLARHYWITLAFTAAVLAYLSGQIPFNAQTMPYWGAAILIILSTLSIRWLNRPAKKPLTKNHKEEPSQWQRYAGRQIVIDGTNVLYWDGETAQLDSLRSVVDYLRKRDINPIVFLDASSRHHLKDPSLSEKKFAQALGLPQVRVMVCPAGTEADVFILKFAKKEGLPILSNDRYGDRSKLAKGIKIVKGVITSGRPILDGL